MYYNGLTCTLNGVEVFIYNGPTDYFFKNNLILYKSSGGVENPDYAVISLNGDTPRSVSYANSNLQGFSSNFTATPSFINEAGADFHLKSNSSAINAGTSITDQQWGTLTYKGAAPDVGAFER